MHGPLSQDRSLSQGRYIVRRYFKDVRPSRVFTCNWEGASRAGYITNEGEEKGLFKRGVLEKTRGMPWSLTGMGPGKEVS